MQAAGFNDYSAFPASRLRGRAEARRPGRLAPRLLEHRRRAARRRPRAEHRERRGLSPGLSHRATAGSRRPVPSSGSDASDPHFRLSKALHIADWNGHDETVGQAAARGRRRLGLLQRRQPLDLRRLHVQGGQAVRHEVPSLLALERRGRRSLLCARLPRRRLSPGATPAPTAN